MKTEIRSLLETNFFSSLFFIEIFIVNLGYSIIEITFLRPLIYRQIDLKLPQRIIIYMYIISLMACLLLFISIKIMTKIYVYFLTRKYKYEVIKKDGKNIYIFYIPHHWLTFSFTLGNKPIIFISPRHLNDRHVLIHELSHAKYPIVYYMTLMVYLILIILVACMTPPIIGPSELIYKNNYFALLIGLGIAAFLFYIMTRVFGEPRAESATVKELGGIEESKNYFAELLSSAREEKLNGTMLSLLMFLAGYAGLDKSGPEDYVRNISRNWMVFIPLVWFALPWIPVAAGFNSLTYSLMTGMNPFLLLFILTFSLLLVSYLLSLIVRPILRYFVGENAHKIAIWLSSIYLVGNAIPSPILLVDPLFFLISTPLLTLILMIIFTYALVEKWRTAVKLSTIAYFIFTVMSATMGMIVLWRLGLL